MEKLIKDRLGRNPSPEEEEEYGKAAWPENPSGIFELNAFLGEAIAAYKRKLKQVTGSEDMLALLKEGVAAVLNHQGTFVQTDEGRLQSASRINPQPVEYKTQPRLAMLVARLQEIGIYTDDLIVHVCEPDPRMVRRLPYIVVHIPRLDKEIAVCDEVGEITFVAKKQVGVDVWTHLTKDELKARPEIRAIPFTNEESWWDGISSTLLGEDRDRRKVNIKEVAKKKPPLDLALIKASILAYRQETGKWPTHSSVPVEYGPYAGKEKWKAIDSALRVGARGLPGGSSLVKLYKEVSEEHGLEYVNIQKQPPLNIEDIKASILAHYEETKKATGKGKLPTQSSVPVEYGPYAGKETWSAIESALRVGARGLPGGSSLAELNEEVSRVNRLDYVNSRTKEPLEPAKIRATIYAHYLATQQWPTARSGTIEHGPYAGQETWGAINAALSLGKRGLPGGEHLTDLNDAVSRMHNLNYVNPAKKEPLTVDQIKESILAHRQATGEWPTANSGVVEHGPYAGREKWGAISEALAGGLRGLPGGSSLPKLNAETSQANSLDYANHLQKGALEINILQEAILAHRQATGEWPTTNSGVVQHGPYAAKETWSGISAALSVGVRGLPGGSSLAVLNAEVSNLHELDYVHHSKKEPLTIERIKDSISAHRQATGEWPTARSGAVQHGYYAGKETWTAIALASWKGLRGLPGGSSLAILKREIQQEDALLANGNKITPLNNLPAATGDQAPPQDVPPVESAAEPQAPPPVDAAKVGFAVKVSKRGIKPGDDHLKRTDRALGGKSES
ncbi:MAG: hypothetical protein ACK5R4_03835 [Alphaproteobacteria bacterium]